MDAKRKMLMIAAGATTTIAAVILAFNMSQPRAGPVSKRIGEEIREKHRTSVDIAQLTTFSWTELRIFHPYEFRDRICSNLRLAEPQCAKVAPSMVDERFHLFAFLDGDRIAHHKNHARFNGDFRHLAQRVGEPTIVSVRDARFDVRQLDTTASEKPWFFLKPSSSSNRPLKKHLMTRFSSESKKEIALSARLLRRVGRC